MSGSLRPSWAGWVFTTVTTKSHLGLARALSRNVLALHPGARMMALLADRTDVFFDPAAEEFEIVPVEALGIDGLADLAFKYDAGELCMALKPVALEHVLKRPGVERAVHLDGDILVLRAFLELREALETADIVLTPHILAPLEADGRRPDELDFLRTGACNVGMVALKKSPAAENLLRWWSERLRDGCFIDIARGLFADQKWMDLAPALFGARLLRHRGYNMAYWNIQERPDLHRTEEGWAVGEEPLVFFHFSGTDPERRDLISKHQTRFTLSELGEEYRSLFELYWRNADACGLRDAWRWPFAFGAFSNGVRIPGVVRRLFRSLGDGRFAYPDPFDAGTEGSFFSTLFESPADSSLPLLAAFIYETRPDLWKAFPEAHGRDAAGVLSWVLEHGAANFDLDEHVLGRIGVHLDRIVARDLEAGRLEAERLRESEERLRRETEERVRLEIQEKARIEIEEKARIEAEQRRGADEELREHRERFDGSPKTPWKRGLAGLVGMDRYLRARLAYWAIRGMLRR